MSRLLALAALVLVGCGAPDEDACGLTLLSPEPELRAATESAAARWTKATGCEVRVAPGGVSIALVDHVFEMPDGSASFSDPEGTGEERAGANDYRGIAISRMQMDDLGMSVTHEVGHRLGAKHTETGVMSLRGGALIDEASLESVCARLPCVAFNTELADESL